MGNYRKPDQYYIDRDDQMTIEQLKDLEAKEAAEWVGVTDPEQRVSLIAKQYIHPGSLRIVKTAKKFCTITGHLLTHCSFCVKKPIFVLYNYRTLPP